MASHTLHIPPKGCAHCRLHKISIFDGSNVPVESIRESTRTFRRGQLLYMEGDPADFAMTVYSGWVLRYRDLADGTRQALSLALSGNFLGVQDDGAGRWNHSGKALSAGSLCMFRRRDVDQLMHCQAGVAEKLVRVARHDEAVMFEHITSVGRRSARDRVAHLMLEIFLRLKRRNMVVDRTCSVPLTQEEIGDLLGLTAIHVHRTLAELRQERILDLSRRHLTIWDFEKTAQQFDYRCDYLGSKPLI